MAGLTGARLDCTKPTKRVVRVTSWPQWWRGRFRVEIVLAVVVGVAAFVVAAAVSTAARFHVPAVLLGLFLLLGACKDFPGADGRYATPSRGGWDNFRAEAPAPGPSLASAESHKAKP